MAMAVAMATGIDMLITDRSRVTIRLNPLQLRQVFQDLKCNLNLSERGADLDTLEIISQRFPGLSGDGDPFLNGNAFTRQ